MTARRHFLKIAEAAVVSPALPNLLSPTPAGAALKDAYSKCLFNIVISVVAGVSGRLDACS